MLKTKINKWNEFLEYSKNHEPLIVDCKALRIFSRAYENIDDPYYLLALAGRNLILYEINEFVAIYSGFDEERTPMLKNYSYIMNTLLAGEEGKRLFCSNTQDKPLT